MSPLHSRTLDQLTIDDEAAVSGIEAYRLLKRAVQRSGLRFLVPGDAAAAISWDRALFLNLTFWNDTESADVLCDEHIPADVVAHVAWHHVVSREIARAAGPGAGGAAGLFFAESIASAFDLYLVGRLLSVAPDSDFITTQLPIIADAADLAGLPEVGFAALIEDVARRPEQSFEDLRALLLDAASALLPCHGPTEALAALEGFAGHRFEPLLHHFQLSNWILYARAYAVASPASDEVVRQMDRALRQNPDALAWLVDHWLTN
ncbi:MAG TPA: hypothetical protein VH374_11780 [Polyangia bacterium]|nr:hypothetical protein [Polyangia bacterium]